jgi:hypothetical protein
MDLIWDEAMSGKLRETRGISIEDVARIILDGKYLEILENPVRPGQMLFIIPYQGYTHVVPFVIDNENNIVLKTAYPSRKFHKLYGAEKP